MTLKADQQTIKERVINLYDMDEMEVGEGDVSLERYQGSHYAIGPYGHENGYGFSEFIDGNGGFKLDSDKGEWPYKVHATQDVGKNTLSLTYIEGDMILRVWESIEDYETTLK